MTTAPDTTTQETLRTERLPAPGATIMYDVRGDLSAAPPTARRCSCWPRPWTRVGSRRWPGTSLRRVIAALDAGPVDLFASSGGAVNALALVAAHPGLVRTLVAHEPPLAQLVPDRDLVLTVNRDFADGSRDDPWLWQNNRTCVPYRPDLDALRSASTRVVVAAGEESARAFAGRAAAGPADALGGEVTMFPSHHAGFLGGEFGQQGRPDELAARLREVLDTA
jgi:pimeloyl-ACP methyl ester carboxylesterase